MMRSPKAMAIVCRRPSGEVTVKEEVWRSISGRLKFLRWPFFRGTVVFVEALVNGIQALTYSANQALEEEVEGPLSPWAMAGTILAALGLALGLFVVAPHFLSLLVGRTWDAGFGVTSLNFHLIDGLVKVVFFAGYIVAISALKDVRRLFMYHGAEHMSIHAYEAREPLTVAFARRHPTLHPRCGTAFLLLVLVISIVFFAVVFPFLPKPQGPGWLVQAAFIGVKILLMLPIAGTAYEVTRLAGRHPDNPWLKPLIWPGLMLQKLTTRQPSDDQIEVALKALESTLKIEEAEETEAKEAA
ncbi:MAG: DUF1385 domain-containing protein [Deltaproteobacteria bacterium]|nr:DUF1385 domain-containing protein [Deltaproteobacteria bacterium]